MKPEMRRRCRVRRHTGAKLIQEYLRVASGRCGRVEGALRVTLVELLSTLLRSLTECDAMPCRVKANAGGIHLTDIHESEQLSELSTMRCGQLLSTLAPARRYSCTSDHMDERECSTLARRIRTYALHGRICKGGPAGGPYNSPGFHFVYIERRASLEVQLTVRRLVRKSIALAGDSIAQMPLIRSVKPCPV
jgi:hypothetical protein